MTTIDDIRRRLEAITPGVWHIHTMPNPWHSEDVTVRPNPPHDVIEQICDCGTTEGENVMNDAEFISHAPADIRALLDALDAANARLEAVEMLWRDYLHAEKHNLYHQTLNAVDHARQYFEEHHD